MDTTTNTQSGKRLSFYKLFCEEKYRVLIPIIQRDYAQGRQTTTEIRNIFLDTLYNYLEAGIPNRDLDFVYGSLNKTDEFTDFIPLDGQQRLTTLFLLHWYLYQISDKTRKDEFKNFLIPDGKTSMFTYETRTSSSDFCNALMGHDIDFTKLYKNSLSKTIENSPWFFLSWKYDPTVKSMLTMLEDIHKRSNKKEYFERLIDTEKPVITFLFLNLKDFKLTDDLYIKMNSRGKQLTTFENFKAKFEQHMEKMDIKRKFYLIYDGKDKDVSLKEYFSYKIDTEWANLFWNYRDLVERKSDEDKFTYDDELNNFIRVIFTSQYANTVKIERTGNKEKADNNFEFLLGTDPARKREGYTDKISFYKYSDLMALSNEGILFLVDAFDALVNKNDKLKKHLSDDYKFYFDEEKQFINTLKHNLSNQERIMFHAYIRFLIHNKGNTNGLDQWMRVIHNLSNNTPIDSAVDVSKAIKSVENMLPNSSDILAYLKKGDIDFFSGSQKLEEKIKAYLITKDDNWKNKIENTEHNCFNGQIGFILEFSGIVEYYEDKDNHNCDWNEPQNKNYFAYFNNYAEKAMKVFKVKKENDYNHDFIWERAMLTMDDKFDYLIETSSQRRNLLTKNLRDFSWKRLLRIRNDNDKDEKSLTPRRMLVKRIFDDNLFEKDHLRVSLEKICERKTNTWRDYLINCPELIKYCGQGYIRFINDKDIILMKESQMNHYHSEMFTHFLWYKSFKGKENSYKPFKSDYYYSKSGEDPACILLNDFCHNNIKYEIRIYYCNDDELPNPYEIAFRKSEGRNILDNYGADIIKILTKLGFKWNEGYSSFLFSGEDSNAIIEKLKKVNEELLKL